MTFLVFFHISNAFIFHTVYHCVHIAVVCNSIANQ